MKFKLCFLAVLLSTNAFSQEIKTIYYDADWKEVSNKKDATFFRKVESDPNKNQHFIVNDFYITGELQMQAEMSSFDPEIMDGKASYFFKNGKKSSECVFVNGKENGDYKKWYKNGETEEEGFMQSGLQNGQWKYYYSNGKLRMSGAITNGNKNGLWKVSNLDGKNYLQQHYNNGQLAKIELIDNSKGLYEYFTEIDSTGSFNIVPFIGYKTNEEYKLTEPYIRNNIRFLQACSDPDTFQINYAYTLIWLTNCPYMGKFAINTTKFMVEYTTMEKSYNYSSVMTKMYILGLGEYLLNNNGKINDLSKFHESGATVMLNYYVLLKNQDSKEKSKKLEDLLDLQKKGKLLEYIQKY